MNKKKDDDDMMIADILLRITTIENLLISKGIFSKEEYIEELGLIASKIAKQILQKSKIPGDLDELINVLQGNKKPIIDN